MEVSEYVEKEVRLLEQKFGLNIHVYRMWNDQYYWEVYKTNPMSENYDCRYHKLVPDEELLANIQSDCIKFTLNRF
jgi:hypothetical protein